MFVEDGSGVAVISCEEGVIVAEGGSRVGLETTGPGYVVGSLRVVGWVNGGTGYTGWSVGII